MNRSRRALLRALLVLSFFLFIVLRARAAGAYPTMIAHGYANCVTCHADPSGSGLLTEYGRAQSEILLSTRYGKASEEPSKFSGALFGLIPSDSWLNAGGWVRDGYLATFQNTPNGDLARSQTFKKVDDRLLQMRWELAAGITTGSFRAYGALGVSDEQASARYPRDLVTKNPTGWNLIAREYWLGFTPNDDSLLRAGRMNLPFGLRNPEHYAFVRDYTRTDFNHNQQDGIAFAIHGEKLRAELMAVVGNFQLGPDAFRDRGYSGHAELHFEEKWAAGLSTSVLHASKDLVLRDATTGLLAESVRQAHGLTLRGSPFDRFLVLAEADALVTSVGTDPVRLGFAGWLQADFEVHQGVHLMLTGENLTAPEVGHPSTTRVWLSAWWFAFTHFDLRVDAIVEPKTPTLTLLAQANIYL